MKNRLLKSLALLALSACMLLPSIGCNAEQEGQGEESPQQPTELVTLIANAADDFTIMRADQCSDRISGAAVDLRIALQEQLGYKIGINNDYVDRNKPVPTDTREILVGLTNRQESIDAHAALAEHEYVIRMMGHRLVVIGYDEECTVAAVKALIAMLPDRIIQQEEAKMLQMEQNYEYKGTYEKKVWLDEFDKTSYSYYLDEKLTCKEKSLLGLDSWDDVPYTGSFSVESPAGEGIGFRTEYDNNHWMMINTPTDSFSLSIDDKFKQTVKMWVYINDTNRIA